MAKKNATKSPSTTTGLEGYRARAAQEYAAAVEAGYTEYEALEKVASLYFVSVATLQSWLPE